MKYIPSVLFSLLLLTVPLNSKVNSSDLLKEFKEVCNRLDSNQNAMGIVDANYQVVNNVKAICFITNRLGNNELIEGNVSDGTRFELPHYLTVNECINQIKQTGNSFCQ